MRSNQQIEDGHLFGRQGDVHFVNRRIPPDAKRIPLRPFALGEVTRHSHAVVEEDAGLVEMYERDGLTFVRVIESAPRDVRVKHEDHDPTATTSVLPVGWEGEVIIAEEYDEEEGFRPVVD